jgi:hypothetical protein
MKVSAFALEEFVRKDRDANVKVSSGNARSASLAFTSQADAGPIVNAGRNIDGQSTLTSQAARTRASRTLSFNNLAMAVTGRTGALKSK